MYKLEWISPKCVAYHTDRFGGFNDYPPNWVEVTESELIRGGMMIYAEQYQEFRQMFRRDGNSEKMIAATLYFFPDGSGYAIETDYEARKFRYYMFAACLHEFGEDLGKRVGEHIYKCRKCGYRKEIDSSD